MKSNSILDQLIDIFVKDKSIDEFQLYETNNTTLKAGFSNHNLGGIYQPIQSHTQSRLNYLIIAKNGKQSQGSLNPFAINDIDRTLKQIKNNLFEPSVKTGLSPKVKNFKPTKLLSKDLQDIIESKPEEIVEYSKLLFKDQKSLGLSTIESQVRMRLRNQRFVSSNGNNLESSETIHDYYIDYNSEIAASKESCDFIPTSEFSNTHKIAKLAKSLRQTPAKPASGVYPILFDPYYGFSILDKYILENINGVAVDSNISRFRLEDFKLQKQIAKTNVNIAIDQTIPMNTDSFNFSTEGIVGQKFKVIDAGKLTTPICDLQIATKLGKNPLVLPSLSTGIYTSLDYNEFIEKYPKFVLVLSVLGIHTQNAITGDYSLPCPSALYFEDGKLIGPINCILTGNFFEKLNDNSFDFIAHPTFNKPLLSFESEASVQ
jgi:PmbA protein